MKKSNSKNKFLRDSLLESLCEGITFLVVEEQWLELRLLLRLLLLLSSNGPWSHGHSSASICQIRHSQSFISRKKNPSKKNITWNPNYGKISSEFSLIRLSVAVWTAFLRLRTTTAKIVTLLQNSLYWLKPTWKPLSKISVRPWKLQIQKNLHDASI